MTAPMWAHFQDVSRSDTFEKPAHSRTSLYHTSLRRGNRYTAALIISPPLRLHILHDEQIYIKCFSYGIKLHCNIPCRCRGWSS
jgi:hypothetical protein